MKEDIDGHKTSEQLGGKIVNEPYILYKISRFYARITRKLFNISHKANFVKFFQYSEQAIL